VTVDWVPYTGCPSDLALSGYNVNVNNGGNSVANPLLPADTQEDITMGSTGSTVVTYTAICGSGSSAIQSDPSPALTLPIT
jgi:hypothetical protein